MLSYSKNNRGFGVVESIVAMFILSLLSYALYSVFSPVQAKFQKDRMRSTMRALESAMISLVEDPIALRLFRNSAQFEISFGIGDMLVVNDSSAEYQTFNLDGKKCGALDMHCPIKLKANFTANKFTYEISTNGLVTSVEIIPNEINGEVAVDANLAKFQNSDATNCVQGQIPRGISTTGTFECWNVNLTTCNPGEIPKGMTFQDSGGVVVARMNCVPMREFKCPPLYVMNKIDLSNLDTTKPLTSNTILNSDNKCIFFAQGRFPASTFDGLLLPPTQKCPTTIVGNQSLSNVPLTFNPSDNSCVISQPDAGVQKVGTGP